MGVDKDDIRFIIHYHQPTNLADYVQEIGRAGRDGRQSVAVLLTCPGDDLLARQLTTVDLPPLGLLEKVRAGQLPPAALGRNHELFTFTFASTTLPTKLSRRLKSGTVRPIGS
jgi:Superfamily II DNA helicase